MIFKIKHTQQQHDIYFNLFQSVFRIISLERPDCTSGWMVSLPMNEIKFSSFSTLINVVHNAYAVI